MARLDRGVPVSSTGFPTRLVGSTLHYRNYRFQDVAQLGQSTPFGSEKSEVQILSS
jgi:hypothetical protein